MTKTQLPRYMAEQLDGTEAGGWYLQSADRDGNGTDQEAGEFTVPGLGKLVKAQRAARMDRNATIGESIKIKAKTTVKIRLAKAAKDAVVPLKP